MAYDTIRVGGQDFPLKSAEEALRQMYPLGIIIHTTGTTLPGTSGWQWERITGGSFLMAAENTGATRLTGGSNTLTSVPEHSHGVGQLSISGGTHTHNVYLKFDKDASTGENKNRVSPAPNGSDTTTPYITDTKPNTSGVDTTSSTAGKHTHTISGSTASAGTSGVDNRPQYYSVNMYRLVSYGN